jgi:hypothetical protein
LEDWTPRTKLTYLVSLSANFWKILKLDKTPLSALTCL